MDGFLKAPNPKKKEKKPFLLELLLGISLFIVVGLVIYMTLNPRKGEEEMRNAERSQTIVEIAAAVKKYVDATGNLPKEIPLNRECASIGNEICKLNAEDCTGYIQLKSLFDADLLNLLSADELRTSGNGTGYYISHDGDGSVMICAPLAERGADISLEQFVY